MSDAAELSPGRTLWEALGDIPDRRGAKGRRYPLRSVLTLSLAAMLAGGNDLCSIFRWGRRLPPEALYLLGLKRAPCHAMYHYFYVPLLLRTTTSTYHYFYVPLLLRTTTSPRPSTWPRPNRCWAPGRKGPDRSEPWRSTASACAGVPRPGTTAARVCTWWRPLPASLGR